MFDHHCTACGKRQLIFPSQITSMDNTEHGIVVAFRCWCGADQTMRHRPQGRRPSERGRSLPDARRRSTRRRTLEVRRRFRPRARASVYFPGLPGRSRPARAARRLSSVGRAIHS